MPPDVIAKIEADFQAVDRIKVIKALENLRTDLQSEGYRVVRCVLYLAQGDMQQLDHYVERARYDWRDVIYWAEYDKQDNRTRDLTRPFPLAES